MARFLGMLLTAAALLMAGSSPGRAQDYQAGVAAFNRGDYATALKQWRPLAAKGNVGAQHYLGILYTQGLGVPKDHAKAVQWFKKAAEAGHAPSAYNLGFRYLKGEGVRQNAETGARWITRAAQTGLVPAQHTLGLLYANGDGVRRDFVVAYFWFSLSAKQKNQIALKDRETIVKQMTPQQIREAEAMVARWRPKKGR